MTVKELIDLLRECNEDSEVLIFGDNNNPLMIDETDLIASVFEFFHRGEHGDGVTKSYA